MGEGRKRKGFVSFPRTILLLVKIRKGIGYYFVSLPHKLFESHVFPVHYCALKVFSYHYLFLCLLFVTNITLYLTLSTMVHNVQLTTRTNVSYLNLQCSFRKNIYFLIIHWNCRWVKYLVCISRKMYIFSLRKYSPSASPLGVNSFPQEDNVTLCFLNTQITIAKYIKFTTYIFLFVPKT